MRGAASSAIRAPTITKRVLAEFVRHGTTTIRTHVDVDPDVDVRAIDAVREAAASYDGALTVEIIAFPQDGVLRRPGVLDMMREAARKGVEHLGGIDPASIDRDPVGQLDAIFGLAAEYGTGIDIHLHDAGDLGAFQFELIIARTEALGLAGKVNIAHGFAVAQVDPSRRRDLLQAMGALDITMTTVAPLRLAAAAAARDGCRGCAFRVRHRRHPRPVEPLRHGRPPRDRLAVRASIRASSATRTFVASSRSRLATAAGSPVSPSTTSSSASRADIVLLDAENPMDALVRTPAARDSCSARGRVLYAA